MKMGLSSRTCSTMIRKSAVFHWHRDRDVEVLSESLVSYDLIGAIALGFESF